ncbi:helix-turn-helix transcriptional regulator [Ureibacillus xyleni]|uniref:helix-turn-helix transcriptional regulator n=1 Tax=Ureibacillus xyleni TaxID=614648 RepID=UPI000BE2FD36|nr:WYL domain-containing protein [Ureibacillus xyleni]
MKEKGSKEKEESTAQLNRILSIFDRLSKGHAITKQSEATNFHVNEKTIQRDIENIRSYLETAKTNYYLEYNRKEKVYKLETDDENYLRNEQILAIVKILIESRAFPKPDMDELIDKLTNLAQPTKQPFIKKIMSNEKYNYVDLQHKQSLFGLLWELAKAIHTKKVINIRYKREFDQQDSERTIKPVGIIFSEYYFYLIAYQSKIELDFPTIYRIDRITACNITSEHFKLPYKDRFEEGEFRKKIQFMYAGELLKVKFRFNGPSPQAVLDRLPNAYKLSEDEKGIVFEAEVFGKGVKMWLLSQGENVEVLEPKELRDDIQLSIKAMLEKYQK